MNRATRGRQLLGAVEILDSLTLGGEKIEASAAEINKLVGVGGTLAAGTPAANIPAVAVTYTANNPNLTPSGAVTIADGSDPTVGELLAFCVELNAKVAALTAALEAFGIVEAAE